MYTAGAQQTQIIGYRGAMGHAPENTVLSVQKALALDVDGIEIDVFRCQSGEIVVFMSSSGINTSSAPAPIPVFKAI